jgi:hypothetical protein
MRVPTLLVRCLATAAAAAAALPAVNCTKSGTDFAKGTIADRTLLGKDGSPTNHRLLMKGTKRQGGATYRTSRRLWAPFRWEGNLAVVSPGVPALGDGRFGISLVPGDFGGSARFVAISLRRSGDGIEIFPEVFGDPPVATTTLVLPEGAEADVAIEHDGTDLVLSARAPGGVFQELARAASADGPYQPSLDAGDVPNKTVVGWDGLQLAFTGRPPGPLTESESLREDVYAAADDVVRALHLVDGPAPDVPATSARLDAAVAALDDALAAATGAGVPKTARAKLSKARKKVAKVADQTASGRPPALLFFPVEKAAIATIKAADALD